MPLPLLLAVVAIAVAISGCKSPRDRDPDVAAIYRDAALDEIRNPVVVIHGILGARLKQRSTGKVVWGAFTSEGIDPETAEGARALALSLEPPASAFDYDPVACDVYPAGPLGAIQLGILYTVLSVNVYASILRALGTGGFTDQVAVDPSSPRYADDHYTCYSFFYDWRRDNVENALRLGSFLQQTRNQIEISAKKRVERLRADGSPPALHEADRVARWLDEGFRFDIVAHSMGGLIARYWLRYGARDLPADGSLPPLDWAGAADIDRLILVGTPNLGSIDALRNLVEGFQPAFILPYFNPALLGTMPSIYQLLPRARHRLLVDRFGAPVDVDFMDPAVWERNSWGLLSPLGAPALAWLLPDEPSEEQRRAIAKRYLAWCLERARRFHAALDVAPPTPCPARLSLFAGDAEPTLVKARLSEGSATLAFEGTGLDDAGDATVPRYSAVGDERYGSPERTRLRSPIQWSDVTFLADDHLGLTRNPQFVDNLLFQLLEQPLHRAPPKR